MQKKLTLVIRDIDAAGNVVDTTVSDDIGNGPQGTDATVACMFGILTTEAGRFVTPNYYGTPPPQNVEDVYRLLRNWQSFTPDPRGIELVRTPRHLALQVERFGLINCDCDDIAILGASMLAYLGLAPIFAVVGGSRHRFAHIHRFEHILFGWQHTPGELSRETVTLMDPQERRKIGHWPPEPYVRLYSADGQHAIINL